MDIKKIRELEGVIDFTPPSKTTERCPLAELDKKGSGLYVCNKPRDQHCYKRYSFGYEYFCGRER